MSVASRAIDARTYRVRLLAPDPNGTQFVLEDQTYSGEWLPTSSIATSPDLLEGNYSLRLNDAGDFEISFPNVTASDGVPWRTRFDPDGKQQFVEIYRELDLEFVGVVERVDVDRGTVKVSGGDAFGLLKSVFERDRTWTDAPADVINAYCRVPVLVVGDDFEDGSFTGWTITKEGVGNVTATEAAGYLKFSSTVSEWYAMEQTFPFAGYEWRAQVVIAKQPRTAAPATTYYLEIGDNGANVQRLTIDLEARTASFHTEFYPGGTPVLVQPDARPLADVEAPVTLTIEGQDRWVRAYVNGELVGIGPGLFSPSRILFRHDMNGSGTQELWLEQITFVERRPFLQTDSTIGTFRLPGDYPPGGLRGRYWNDQDLSALGDNLRLARCFAPDREPYGERLDPVIDTSGGLSIPLKQTGTAVASDDYFSVRWFGAVYLDPGNGTSCTFELSGVDDRCRLYVGATKYLVGVGPNIDNWFNGALGTFTDSVFYSFLDPESRAGWYPILVEFAEISGAATISLKFTPGGSGTYVDPGGTTITRGAKITIPSSSLSPLGCFDGRVQGQSHFDLVRQVASEYGYELLPQHYSLEDAFFPALVYPADRFGRDTDVELVVEEDESGTPILNPGSTVDSSEQAIHLIGNANGLNFGRGDVTAEVADLSRASSSLFMLQRWVDAGDISFADLLAARLNAELALYGEPWQEIRGNPLAQDRLADTFPLSDSLELFNWTPGDGVRVFVPEVGIEDVIPRRITQLTRTFERDGRTGAQVGFRNRPRGRAVELRRLAQATMKPLRSKSAQISTVNTIPGSETINGGTFGGYSRIPLMNQTVIRATLEVYVNTGSAQIGWEINGASTPGLGSSPNSPVVYDITPYVKQASNVDGRCYIRPFNASGFATILEWSWSVDVLR